MKTNEQPLYETVEWKKSSQIKRWTNLLLRSKTGTIGFLIVSIVVFLAIFANQISPYDPAAINAAALLQPPVWSEGGNWAHILGTDNLGRDMLSRLIHGSRISLLVGVSAVIVAGVIGMAVGLIAGYFGGIIDNVLMRFVDTFLAIPSILFILVVLGVFGPGLVTLVLVLGAINWVLYARLIRGEVLSVKELQYVKAAKTIGTSHFKIMLKHLMPNVFSSFIVVSTLSVATTIIVESSLSFLGLGIQPPQITWGLMLSTGRDYLATSWWLATFPGIAITITVLGIIFLGDWLRDVLDPRSQHKKS